LSRGKWEAIGRIKKSYERELAAHPDEFGWALANPKRYNVRGMIKKVSFGQALSDSEVDYLGREIKLEKMSKKPVVAGQKPPTWSDIEWEAFAWLRDNKEDILKHYPLMNPSPANWIYTPETRGRFAGSSFFDSCKKYADSGRVLSGRMSEVMRTQYRRLKKRLDKKVGRSSGDEEIAIGRAEAAMEAPRPGKQHGRKEYYVVGYALAKKKQGRPLSAERIRKLYRMKLGDLRELWKERDKEA